MPTDPEFWLQVGVETLALFFMLIGLVGLIVPIFPGLLVIWLAALGYGIAVGFDVKGWIIFALVTILMIFGSLVDNVLMGAKARQGGASWISIGLGLLAGVAGSLMFPPFGGILAAPLTLFLAEYVRRKRNWNEAFATVKALVVGWGWAFVIRFAIGVVMTGLWMIWAWT